MPKTDYRPKLFPHHYYHCVNRTLGNEILFREEANYHFFLAQYAKYIAPIATTYAFCLMPNHFHFLIRIKSVEKLQCCIKQKKRIPNIDWNTFDYSVYLSKQFSNFFNSYVKAYNKRYKRRGPLFESHYKRPEVIYSNHLFNTIRYIHLNPVKHGFVSNLEDWRYSSYHAYLDETKTGTYKKDMMAFFGSVEAFVAFHQD